MKLLILLIILTNTLFILSMNPISMGLSILMQTLLLSMSMMMISNYSWSSYIIMLIMVGGMMVLFTYMSSIASKQKISNMKFKNIIMMMFVIMLLYPMNMTELIFINDMYINMNKIMVIKMINSKSSMITLMIMTYLFITMTIINMITNIYEGPIRMKTYDKINT